MIKATCVFNKTKKNKMDIITKKEILMFQGMAVNENDYKIIRRISLQLKIEEEKTYAVNSKLKVVLKEALDEAETTIRSGRHI